ncbi:restriction endonuclease [Nocardia gipuzkoensis]
MSEFEVEIDAEGEHFAELCRVYWETNADGSFVYTVKSIAEVFGLPAHKVSKLVSDFSAARSTSKYCIECGKGFIFKTRSDWSSNSRYSPGRCRECVETERRRQAQQQARIKAAARAAIAERYPILSGAQGPRAEDLDMPIAFALAALFEDAEEFYRGVSAPINQRTDPLTPTADFDFVLLERLVDLNLIRIHPSSSTDSFVWDAAGGLSEEYYPRLASYYMLGHGMLEERVNEFRQSFAEVVYRDNWPDKWTDQFHDFWLDIAVSECKAYLVHMLDRYSLTFNPGAKTDDVFRRGLKWYSIGQIYYFVWRAAKESAAYYLREKVPAKQAANSAITRISAEINRAYTDGWKISTYQRDSKLPVSTMSHILFSRALRIDDPMAYSPVDLPVRRAGLELAWKSIEPDDFERLIFQLVAETEGYENVDWLMHTNAPDHGRDVSAIRLRHDPLSGHSSQRVAIQCKHWTTRAVRDADVGAALVSLDHWQDPPFDVLVIATSGRFTSDAVAWIERHNSKGQRPSIEVWNDARLELLLDERPHLIRSFELR